MLGLKSKQNSSNFSKATSVAGPSITLPAEESLDKDSVLSSGAALKNYGPDTTINKSYLEALKHLKYPVFIVALAVIGISLFSLWRDDIKPGNSDNRSNFAQLNADLGNAASKSSAATTLQINVDTLVKSTKNTSNTFLVQSASGESLFRADSVNTQIEINGLLSVNGDIVSNGTIVLGGGSSLNSEGLRINNILVCNSTGCIPRPGAGGAIDLNNIDAANITRGTLSDSRLSGLVTLQGNVFNGPNQLVKLDGSGQLPPGVIFGSFAQLNANQTFSGDNTFSSASNSFTGNGAGLTSLNAGNVSSGTLNDARLSANVTLQGNTFNGLNQLVRLDASGNLPALNASALTSLNATNIATGTLADARLSTNVSLLGSSIDSTEITNDSINDNDISSAAGISWSKISKTGSSLADLATRSATDLNSGTLADGRLSSNVALLNTGNTFTNTNLIRLNSASAFQVQDASSNGVFLVNTTSNSVLLGTSGALNGTIVFNSATSPANVTIQPDSSLANAYTLLLPALAGGTYAICTDSGNCSGAGATLQTSYNNSTTPEITVNGSNGAVTIQDNSTPIAANLFEVQNNGGATKYLEVSASSISLGVNTTLVGGKSLTIVGGVTGTRPASPSAGMLYYDSTTNQILQYNGTKWISDRNTATKIVAASNSSQAAKDAADYVADGTGDQVEINAALTAASGGSVYLMEGTYIANATILIPNNTTLAGAGRGTLIELADIDATDNLIENSDTSTGTGVAIRDLRLDGRNDLNTAGTQNGVYLNGMGSGSGASARQGLKILNILVNRFRDSGIRLDTSTNNTLTGNTIQGNGSPGIYMLSSSNNTLTGNTVQGNIYGIRMDSSTNNTLTGNTTEGNSYGIYLSSSTNNTLTGNTTSGNSQTGVSLQSSSTNNTLTGNTVQGNASIGIILNSSSNNTLTGNTVQGNNNQGIYMLSSNSSIVSSNKIDDNGGNTSNEGIYLGSSDFNSISGNNITDSACTSTCRAINISDSTSDKNYLEGNRFSGSAANTASINDAGTSTIYVNQQTNSTTSTNSDVSDFRFRGSADSATAFQVQNASGGQLLNIDTSTPTNIITNGSLEVDTAGWSARGSSTLNRNTTQKYIGNASLSVATTSAIGDGAKFNLTTATLASNTKYTLTMVARTAPGSSMSTFQMGRQENGSIDSDCFTTDQTITGSGWTTLSCTFTTSTTSGTPNIYLEQTDATARTIFIDAVQLTRFSRLNNHSVEQAITASDWQPKGTPTTHARVTSQFIDGAASLQVTTTATADQGTKNNLTLNPSTYYTVSFHAALDTTSATFSTLEAGYSSDGTTDNTICTTAQTVRFNWKEYRCSFVTPSATSGTPYFYIKQTDAAIHTFYIDNVRLVQGNALGSYKEGEISLSGTISSPAVFQNQSNSNSAFQIQNVAGSNLLQVDTEANVVSLFGSNTGEINAWRTTSSVSEIKARHSSVAWGGYVYTFGDDSGGTTKVEYAKANSDGTLGTWGTTTALPAARERHMSVAWNGYIYVIGGDAANTSYYAKINSDGTIGSWATTTALPINIRHAGTTVANGYVYILGGDTGGTAVYYAKLNADGTLGSWNTTTSIPATKIGPTSQVANGYIYVIGGSLSNTIYYAQLNSNGTVGSWTTDSTLPVNLRSHTSVINNGHLYIIGGDTANSGVASSVTYAPINANGSPGTWKTSVSQMSTPRYSHTSVVVNGYIYAIAGHDGTIRLSSVEYTSTARVRMAGSLDLVGLNSGNLTEGGDISQGSIGGSLTAGNGRFVGSLEVQGQAAFAQGLSIQGNLSTSGSVAFRNTANSTTAFQVQNAANSPILSIDTSTNNLITNGSFETDTTGWSSKISLAAGVVRQTTYAGNGSASASFTTSATAGSGVRYTSFAMSSNTMYSFSAQVRTNYGTVAANTIVLGYQNTANQTDTTSDNDCTTSPAITTGWTYLSCTFTTGTVTGGGVIYLKQTDATSRALFVDSAQLTLYSQLTNPSIEQAIGGNWIVKNLATVTQDNSQAYIGTNSLKIVTTTAASDGTRQNLTLATSTTYTMSFYAKLDGASAALDTMEAGYSSDGATDGNVCITGQTVVATGWTKYTCTLVTPSSTSGTPFIYVKHASATAHTFYVDALQLIKGQMNDGYQDGRITLNGIISNAITLQNANDSTGAFQVQKADGTSLFTIDTSNNMITLGAASSTPVLLVLGNKNTSGDPTCTSGAIYYNSNTNQFRGCQNSVWKDFMMDTNNALPWLIDIDVFPTAISHINWDNIYTGNTSTDSLYQGEKISTGAQNDEINWNIVLAAGTWDVELIYRTDTDGGIYSVQFDGVQKGTIDSYSASTTNNVRGSVTGITVSTTGKIQLKLKMTSKNASSSNYRGYLKHVQLRRTL